MPKTKKVEKPEITPQQQAQLDKEIDDEGEDIARDKPKRGEYKPREPQGKSKEDEYKEALKDLLINLGSKEPDDLKQLTFLSLKIRDPMAKGMAYYDATLPEIETQCGELLQWYIDKCNEDIEVCKKYIESIESDSIELEVVENELKDATEDALTKINAGVTESEMVEIKAHIKELESQASVLKNSLNPPAPPSVVLVKVGFWKKIWYKIFGSPKIVTTPELEVYDAKARLKELEERLVELKDIQSETMELDAVTKEMETIGVDTDTMYFKKWVYNYLLLCRSQLGDDNYLKMKVMLADGQIVNKQESGSLDMSSVFKR